MDDAEEVVTEATALQPSINITAESVRFMHIGLLESEDIYLPYSSLLFFLALGHKRLLEPRPQGMTTAELQKIVKTVVEDLGLILPSPTNSTTTISAMSPDLWPAPFTSVPSSLKELLAYNERHMEAIAK